MSLPLEPPLACELVKIMTNAQPGLEKTCRNRLLGEEHLVKEFIQEAMADLLQRWEREGQLSEVEAMRTLHASLDKDILDHRRKRTRRRTDPIDIHDEVLIRHADPKSQVEVLAILGRIDLDRELRRLLPEDQRQAIVLVYVDDLDQAEAAALLGLSTRGLQERLRKARNRLREHTGFRDYLASASTTEHTPSSRENPR